MFTPSTLRQICIIHITRFTSSRVIHIKFATHTHIWTHKRAHEPRDSRSDARALTNARGRCASRAIYVVCRCFVLRLQRERREVEPPKPRKVAHVKVRTHIVLLTHVCTYTFYLVKPEKNQQLNLCSPSIYYIYICYINKRNISLQRGIS